MPLTYYDATMILHWGFETAVGIVRVEHYLVNCLRDAPGVELKFVRFDTAAGLYRDVTAAEAPDYVLGWTVVNDVTAVDQVALDEKMVQAKCGDGFTPLGPWIETELDPFDARLEASVAGRHLVSTSAALAWNPFEAIAYLSSHLTLGPGDVICTGAPHTSFAIEPGDECVCTVAGIGTLSNPVSTL